MEELKKRIIYLQNTEYKYYQLEKDYAKRQKEIGKLFQTIDDKDCLINAYKIMQKMNDDIQHLSSDERINLHDDLYKMCVDHANSVKTNFDSQLSFELVIINIQKKYNIDC